MIQTALNRLECELQIALRASWPAPIDALFCAVIDHRSVLGRLRDVYERIPLARAAAQVLILDERLPDEHKHKLEEAQAELSTASKAGAS